MQLRAREAAPCEDHTCQGSGQCDSGRQREVSVQAQIQAFVAGSGTHYAAASSSDNNNNNNSSNNNNNNNNNNNAFQLMMS